MSGQFSNRLSPPTPAVLLFGEVLMDRFPDREVLGGAPFNVARHLRGFGLDPVLVTRVGNDGAGTNVLREMDRLGLSVQGVQHDPVHPTGQVRIELGLDGHRFDILPDQAYDYMHATVARMVTLATRPSLVYFGTLAQRAGSHAALREILRACGDSHTFLDVNLRDPWVDAPILDWSLGQADTVKVNEEELERIANLLGLPKGTPEQRGAALIEAYELTSLLVTRGAQGAWQMQIGGGVEHIPGERVDDLVDTVGAGDAFAAVYMVGHLYAWPVNVTLLRAQRVAAAICRIRGAIPADDGFYASFLREWFGAASASAAVPSQNGG